MQPLSGIPDFPRRPVDGHKGTFGRVLVIAGSRGMTGAAVLAGTSALRGGAGLVTVAAPESSVPIIAACEPSYMTLPLKEDRKGRIHRSSIETLRTIAEEVTAVALGPGLGRSRGLIELVTTLYREVSRPMVVDADALNALSQELEESPDLLSTHAGPRILTPHPGEFSRLTGLSIDAIQADREQSATRFAAQHKLVLVLKGPRSVITDGEQVAVNTTGNSGMATGGTGDVLTGLLSALLAQQMNAFEAARLGVWLHGRAGDLAAAALSQPGLIASDLPRWLCEAWRDSSQPTKNSASG